MSTNTANGAQTCDPTAGDSEQDGFGFSAELGQWGHEHGAGFDSGSLAPGNSMCQSGEAEAVAGWTPACYRKFVLDLSANLADQ
jgi:hypothetical protein